MAEVFRNLDWSVLTNMILSIIPALISITLHELSHGFVAYKLGDNTAKSMGRLTLNPLKHIDIFGLVMMAVFHFGWAKPVPVNMRNFKNPKRGMAITAAAGPCSNIIICIVFLALYGFFYPLLVDSDIGTYVLQILYLTAWISLGLAVFNIIPIPPLDGSKVLFSCISDELYYKLMRYERYGMILLIILVSTRILGQPLSDVTEFLFDKLFFIAEGANRLGIILFA